MCSLPVLPPSQWDLGHSIHPKMEWEMYFYSDNKDLGIFLFLRENFYGESAWVAACYATFFSSVNNDYRVFHSQQDSGDHILSHSKPV